MSEGYKKKKSKKVLSEWETTERSMHPVVDPWDDEPDDDELDDAISDELWQYKVDRSAGHLEGGMTDPDDPMTMDPAEDELRQRLNAMDPADLAEGCPSEEEETLEEYDETGTFAPGQGERAKKKKKDPSEEDNEAALQQALDADRARNENWTRENKDQLLFERLMKKWCK